MNDSQAICRVCNGPHPTGACVGDARISMTPFKREQVEKDMFDVPNSPDFKPVGDEEPTVRATMVRGKEEENVKKRAEISKQIEKNQAEQDRAQIFEAVASNNEDPIKSLLIREFGLKQFSSLQDFEGTVRDFISGDEDHTINFDVSEIGKPQVFDSKMEIVFRPRIGADSPFVVIELGNLSGLGKQKGEKQTSVISVNIDNPNIVTKSESKPSWFAKLFGKKDK